MDHAVPRLRQTLCLYLSTNMRAFPTLVTHVTLAHYFLLVSQLPACTVDLSRQHTCFAQATPTNPSSFVLGCPKHLQLWPSTLPVPSPARAVLVGTCPGAILLSTSSPPRGRRPLRECDNQRLDWGFFGSPSIVLGLDHATSLLADQPWSPNVALACHDTTQAQ